jgi:hypothetical protein
MEMSKRHRLTPTKEQAMQNSMPLPTQNPEWGFWGTSIQNGYEATMCWDTASRFFADTYQLTPEEVTTLLDARFGRHLADDLSFIEGGPATPEAITKHLSTRHANHGWRRSFEKAIREETGKKIKHTKPKSKAQLLTAIAQNHLNIETLKERKSDSHDFHEVAVWSLKAALEAAFEAGKSTNHTN